jgi:cell division protein FtsB
MAFDRRLLIRRIVVVVGIGLAAVFAVQGGEFGTLDLVRQRSERARISRAVDSLQRTVDSLKRYEAAVRTDPATQERIAREVFGMVRGDKEILYRFTDSTSRRAP